MNNSDIRQFRDTIIAMTNASPLPIEIKRLVFSDIQKQITTEADKAIIAERSAKEETNEQNNTQKRN